MKHRNSTIPSAEMSYFRLQLHAYLQDTHPDKADNLSFIAARGDSAAEAYSNAIKNWADHVQAAEFANQIFFEGLHFSPFNTLFEILWKEFFEALFPQHPTPTT